MTYKIKNQNRLNNILKRQERDTECISQTHRKTIFLVLCKQQKYTEENQVNFGIPKNEIDICSSGFDNIRQTYNLIGNKITKHMINMYNYIENITYFSIFSLKMLINYVKILL